MSNYCGIRATSVMAKLYNKVFQKIVAWTRLNQFTEEMKLRSPIIAKSYLAQLQPRYIALSWIKTLVYGLKNITKQSSIVVSWISRNLLTHNEEAPLIEYGFYATLRFLETFCQNQWAIC